MGRRTVNAAPAPGALRTEMAPPCASHDPLDEAQAKPRALDLRLDDGGRSIERVEDALVIGRIDADPAIGDTVTSTSLP